MINQQEADRIPIDLGGFQTGIHRKAYEDLIAHLGFDEEIKILDPVQQLAKPSEVVFKRFHVDTRYICAHGPDSFKGGIELNERDGRKWHDLKDEFGVIWSMPDDQMLYMDPSHHPLANATLEDLKSYPFPDGSDPTRFATHSTSCPLSLPMKLKLMSKRMLKYLSPAADMCSTTSTTYREESLLKILWPCLTVPMSMVSMNDQKPNSFCSFGVIKSKLE